MCVILKTVNFLYAYILKLNVNLDVNKFQILF